jgi:predicted oxidoreductase
MKSSRFPYSDLSVSRIAYGCANLAGWDDKALDAEDKSRADRIIQTAVEQGITLFDHADLYAFGKSETLFGEVLRASPGLRRTLVIQSKCGQVFSPNFHWGMPIYVDLTRQHIETSVEGSLKRLGTDYLDILLLHAPSTLVKPDEVAEAFDHLHRDGKVRYFGVSNYAPAQIRLLKKSVKQPIVVNQIRLGLGYPHAFVDGTEFTVELFQGCGNGHYFGMNTASVLDYCRLEDIQVQAWSPLRGGFLSAAPDSPPQLQALAHELAELAKSKDTTPATLALAWLLHHPAGVVPITGSSAAEHLIQNCASDQVTLTDTEWYALLAASVDLPSLTNHNP